MKKSVVKSGIVLTDHEQTKTRALKHAMMQNSSPGGQDWYEVAAAPSLHRITLETPYERTSSATQ